MVNKLAMGIVRAGRTAVSVVGLAVVLALVLGVATTALAGTGVGATFNLGKVNSVSALSTLVGSTASSMLKVDNNGAGTALDLQVGPSTTPPEQKAAAPMQVDSQAKVVNLNADELDGKDSAEFLGKTEKAADADKIDGKDSSQFATATSEGWHQISTSGTTPFDRFYDGWSNFDSQHSTAAYYKDSQGIVHLKGVVRGGGFYDCCYNTERGMIFLLPQGYWPSEHRVFTAVSGSNTAVGRIDIGRGGCLATENIPSGTCGAAVQAVGGSSGWITLDGISFRAEG